MASSSSAGPSVPQTIRPTNPEDWEPYKEVISQLYTEIKLKDVMREMERNYGFKATEKQYKTQIKKWSLDTKYVKSSEYLAMIKTKRRRERENPPKETRFTLRGRPIDPRDIIRFEKRAIKKGLITHDDSLSSQGELPLPAPGPPVGVGRGRSRLREAHSTDASSSDGTESLEDLGYETPSPSGAVYHP